jgi:AcrR family transcriptional regulator
MVTSKKRSAPLTKDELVGRALAIVDAEGLQALTMRRLAAEVSVEAASLYHHLPSKDALIDGMVIRIRSEVRVPDPLPADLLDIMLAIFVEYYRVLAAHPNLIQFAGRRVESDPDSGLVALAQSGLSEDDAVELWQSVLAFIVGFALFGATSVESDVRDLPTSLATRMSEWRDETCVRTLRAILESYWARRESQPGAG